MKISRRTAIKQTTGGVLALASGPLISAVFAQPSPNPTALTRMKIEDFIKDPQRVKSLKHGVEVMKSRKPSDPGSWFFQGAIHGVSDRLLEDAKKQDPDVVKVDQDKFWNRCPHYERLKSPSADFLIWHRAYVYHFEQNLRAASEDPQLRLPYWNYLEDGQRTFPRLYGDPDVDPAKPDGPPRNPLFDSRRETVFAQRGLLELFKGAVNIDKAFAEKKFFGAIGTDGFAGSVNDPVEPANAGLIERNPHNLLHLAIGGLIGLVPNPDPDKDPDWGMGLMSNVPTAAFDPVFWAHHCNIDRLWSVWDAMPDRVWGNAPAPAWFDEKPWWFYNEKGIAENSPRSFYIQQRKLGIVFDTDKPAALRLSDNLPGQANLIVFNLAGASGAVGIAAEDKTVALMGTSPQEMTLTPAKPVTASIKVSGRRPFGAPRLFSALTKPPSGSERRALLVVQGIRYTGAPTASYELYANLGSNEKPQPRSKSFIGTLALFGIQHDGHSHEGGNQQIFDVTKAITDRLDTGSEFKVTFIPVPLLTARAGVKAQQPHPNRLETVTLAGMTLSGVESLNANR